MEACPYVHESCLGKCWVQPGSLRLPPPETLLSDPLTRREFFARCSALAGAVLLASCTAPLSRVARRSFGRHPEAIVTRWPIKRVIYLMLENRSFDNLFGRFPGANGTIVGVREGREVPLIRCPEWLPGDLPHDRAAGLASLNEGRQDGFALGSYGLLFAYSQFDRGSIPNYWHWAENFVLCDNFFASTLGPSYPNHLAFIAGQDAGVIDNPENIEVRREGDRLIKSWGIDAYGDDVFVLVEDERGNLTKHSTTFDIRTVGEQLTEREIDWAYYAAEPHQAGYIWSAYSAVPKVFQSELWDRHIRPVDRLLSDIRADALPSVTWITPRFELSDHPPFSTYFAHDWVTAIVNAVMRGPAWERSAIFLTWDEWGGFYDHVPPPVVGNRELGFRVPMLVISPYALRGHVDHAFGEFSAPLRFIADNWGLPYLTDRIRRSHNFRHVFDFARTPRPADPLPMKGGTGQGPRDFPEDFEGWPDGVQASRPDFLNFAS